MIAAEPETDKALKRVQQMRNADRKRYESQKGVRGDVLHEFGEVPKVADPERKRKGFDDLLFFLTESGYFPNTLGRGELCPEQVRMIRRQEMAINNGGNIAHAVFRGGVKSTSLELAVLWSLLTGRKSFWAWYGATAGIAKQGVQSILSELEENDEMAEDWPEACHLFRALEGNHKLCHNQKYDGEKTHLYATGTHIIIPFVGPDGVIERWGCIRSKGLNSDDAARGMRWKAPTGESMRPDGAAIDDPQTDESARSPEQCNQRLKIVTKSIAKAGTRDKKMTIAVAGTVIESDDFMDQVLNPDKFPSFSGERVPQLKAFPTDWLEKKGRWQKYQKIRNDFDKTVPGARREAIERANYFYIEHQEVMDAGGVATWEYAIEPDDLSALQSCMNALFDLGEESFAAECQQKPISIQENEAPIIRIPVDWWQSRMQLERKLVPRDTQAVTIGVDVQQDVLFWLAAGWSNGLSGHICDYGVYPEQPGTTVNLRKLSKTLRDVHGGTIQAALTAGLKALLIPLLQRRWMAVGGAVLPTARLLVDDGHEKDTVDAFVENSGRNQIMLPAKGTNITTKRAPMSEWTLKPGDKMGKGYVINRPGNRTRIVQHDGNIHNTLIESHLRLQTGDVGAITVFEGFHQMLGQHFHAEQGTLVTANGRSLYEWEQVDTRNDLLDSFRMSLVGALMEGISEAGDEAQAAKNAEIEQFRRNMQSMGLKVTRF